MNEKTLTKILIYAFILVSTLLIAVSTLLIITNSEANGATKRWDNPVTFKSVAVAPTQVWIDPQDATSAKLLGEATWHAAAFWNSYTATKFNCDSVLTGGKKPKLICASAPCPQNSYCLQIKYADLPTGQVAKYEDVYCTGGCSRAGRITVDPTEVPFGGIHPWGAEERAMVVQHNVGRFIGLTLNPICTSVMYPAITCPGGGQTPHTLTTAEATVAGAW